MDTPAQHNVVGTPENSSYYSYGNSSATHSSTGALDTIVAVSTVTAWILSIVVAVCLIMLGFKSMRLIVAQILPIIVGCLLPLAGFSVGAFGGVLIEISWCGLASNSCTPSIANSAGTWLPIIFTIICLAISWRIILKRQQIRATLLRMNPRLRIFAVIVSAGIVLGGRYVMQIFLAG